MYSAETEGDTVRFCRMRRESRFLDICGTTTRELVMKIAKKDIGIDIPPGTLDEESGEYLASHLWPHQEPIRVAAHAARRPFVGSGQRCQSIPRMCFENLLR